MSMYVHPVIANEIVRLQLAAALAAGEESRRTALARPEGPGRLARLAAALKPRRRQPCPEPGLEFPS